MLAAGSRRRLSALSADFSVRPELTSLPDATDRISALSASVANYKAQVERAQSALCDERHLQRLYGQRLRALQEDPSVDEDSMPSAQDIRSAIVVELVTVLRSARALRASAPIFCRLSRLALSF